MIKTIKELRDLIIENEGTLTIGAIKVKYSNDAGHSDIDVYLNGDLITWIGEGADDEDLVGEGYSISSDFESFKDKLRNSIKEVEALTEELKNTKDFAQGNDLLKGKVEAYEKLLLERTVTISE